MGKLILISGPNGSGKSRYAESLFASAPPERYYIATMVPQTEENRRRIAKHRAQRADLGFETVECPGPLSSVSVPPEGAVLLEDVSNLLANAVFSRGETAEDVLGDILALQSRCAFLAAVTIGGLSEEGYDGETREYILALNSLNGRLEALADGSAVLSGGVPVWRKGGPDAL